MTVISASLVKELREETGLGMMECKNALTETAGDKAKAIQILRERGMAIAGKKASRTANEGRVAASVLNEGKLGVMIEVNCETDFVAKNENFQGFLQKLLSKAPSAADGQLAELVKDEVMAKIAEIGENIVVRRNLRYEVKGEGAVVSYIHLGSKVGVLLEIGCDKAGTTATAAFKDVAKDVSLHIAATSPQCVRREEVDAALIAQERAIYAKQVEGKPANIVEKIVTGKLEKFYSQIVLPEQMFVKDPEKTVAQILQAAGKALGDNLVIRRFARYQVGA